MFFFFHLVTGIILGFLIADLLHDRRWIVPCVIGAVLPDIVDKPLNYILLPAVSGNGRFLFHNLVVFAILLVAGLLLWKYYRSPLVLALDTGILSHQILDSMWTEPVRWLYPLLGPYPAQAVQPPDYLFDLLLTDLYNPVEWVLIILCTCILLLYWQRGPLAAAAARHKKVFGMLLKCAGIMLWVSCGVVLAYGFLKISLTGLASGAEQDAFTVVVIALAAILMARWEAALKSATPVPEQPDLACDHPVPSPAATGIERMEYLVRLIGKDPDRISFSSAREIAGAFPPAGDQNNRAGEYLTLALLGTIVAVAAAGGIVLLLSGKEIPAGMLALGAIAAGLLAGSLVMAGSTGPAP
ncbi:MAG: metal-dependent hydrolase [Methanoregula sp.]|uniref:metal-dependent hydrolase n=1 Tax=Methanoregula sp. TaxID=2052170 RepID=UPI003C5500AA